MENLVVDFAKRTGLSLLPLYYHKIALSTISCFVIQLVISPFLSAYIPAYRRLRPRTKRDWNIRSVAFLHAIFATLAAAHLAYDPTVWKAANADRSFVNSSKIAEVAAVSSGYFIWDTIISTLLVGSQGVGFLVHAVMCMTVFVQSFRPLFQFFGIVFLTWETSSIFLNIHWALDKLDLTGTIWQFVNGIVLLLTFFGVRLVYGNYNAWLFFQETFRSDVKAVLPDYVLRVSQLAMISLTVLNVYWFHQMIYAIKKRFDGSSQKAKSKRQ